MTELRGALRGEAAMLALGRALGAALLVGDVVALDGDLGAGKTTLVRGLADGLGADPAGVRSPTFVLAHVYREGRIPLHHLDLYRLGAGADLSELAVDDMLEDGALAVEWAGLADWGVSGPPARIMVRLDAPAPDHRVATLAGGAPPRLRDAFGAGLRAGARAPGDGGAH